MGVITEKKKTGNSGSYVISMFVVEQADGLGVQNVHVNGCGLCFDS